MQHENARDLLVAALLMAAITWLFWPARACPNGIDPGCAEAAVDAPERSWAWHRTAS